MHTLVSGDTTSPSLKSQLLCTTKPKKTYQKSNRVWYLGNSIIAVSENYKLHDVNNDKYLSKKINIQDAIHDLKGTSPALVNSCSFIMVLQSPQIQNNL